MKRLCTNCNSNNRSSKLTEQINSKKKSQLCILFSLICAHCIFVFPSVILKFNVRTMAAEVIVPCPFVHKFNVAFVVQKSILVGSQPSFHSSNRTSSPSPSFPYIIPFSLIEFEMFTIWCTAANFQFNDFTPAKSQYWSIVYERLHNVILSWLEIFRPLAIDMEQTCAMILIDLILVTVGITCKTDPISRRLLPSQGAHKSKLTTHNFWIIFNLFSV